VLVRYGWGSVGIGAGMTAAFPYFRSALLPRSIAGGSKARTRLCKHARRTQGKWKKVLWQKTTIRRVLLFEHDSCRTIADGLLAGGTVGIFTSHCCYSTDSRSPASPPSRLSRPLVGEQNHQGSPTLKSMHLGGILYHAAQNVLDLFACHVIQT